MVTITVSGGEELSRTLKSMPGEIRAAVSDALVGTALETRGEVVKSIHNGPASGRVYQKYNPRRVHQASAPGQAPATDTGRLANSIFFDTEGDLTAIVGSRLIYALYLEYGTSKIGQRPFFRPAAERAAPKLERRIKAALEGAIG